MYTITNDDKTLIIVNQDTTDLNYYLVHKCDSLAVISGTLEAGEQVEIDGGKFPEGDYTVEIIQNGIETQEDVVFSKRIREEILSYISDLICDCGQDDRNDEMLELLIIYNKYYLDDNSGITDQVFEDLKCFLMDAYQVGNSFCYQETVFQENYLMYAYYIINYKIEYSTSSDKAQVDVDYNIDSFKSWLSANNLLPLSKITI